MYQNKHLITQKKQTKRHHLFFTPKWKLLNRYAISPQTEIADKYFSIRKRLFEEGGGGGGGVWGGGGGKGVASHPIHPLWISP